MNCKKQIANSRVQTSAVIKNSYSDEQTNNKSKEGDMKMKFKNVINKNRQNIQKHLLAFWLGLLALAAASPQTIAQTDQPSDPKRGAAVGASYSLSDIENINLTNGNLMMNFPLVSLPASRGGLSSSVNLVYNSKLYESRVEQVTDWTGQISSQSMLFQSQDGGWKITIPTDFSLRVESRIQHDSESVPCGSKRAYIWKVHVGFPDGSKKEFRPTGYSDLHADGYFNISPNGYEFVSTPDGCASNAVLATTAPMTYHSADGSYLKLVVHHDNTAGNTHGKFNPWTLYFPDGSNFDSASGKLTDRNGNFVQKSGHGVADQFGRRVYYAQGGSPNETFLFMKGFNDEELKWTIRWKNIHTRREYYTAAPSDGRERGNSSNQISAEQFRVVDEIILPVQLGGQIYRFGYYGSDAPIESGQYSTGWGELQSVTLPSGARASYEYRWNIGESTLLPRIVDILGASVQKKTLAYSAEYDGTTTPVTEIWNYLIGKTSSSITSPDGGVTTQSHGDSSYENQYNGLVFSIRNPNGTKLEKLWGFNYQANCATCSARQINPYVKAEFTSITDVAGNYILTAIKEFNFDKNGNQTQVKEYDFVPYGSIERDAAGRPAAVPQGITPIRVTQTSYYNSTPDASDASTDSANAYWNAASANLRNAVAAVEVRNGSNQIVSRSEFVYDNPSTTGNLTQTLTWNSSKGTYSNPLHSGNSISVSNQYDQHGNLIQATDARGVVSAFTYGNITTPSGIVSGLYPTQTVTAFGTPQQRTSTAEYDFFTGLVKRATDVDNNVSSETIYDAFGRPVIAKAAVGSPNEAWTQTEYNDLQRRVITRSDLFAKGDARKVMIQHFDQLGRVRLSRTLEDAAAESPYDETHGIKVQTRYKFDNPTDPASSSGSFVLKSNPYRTGSENEMGWTVSYTNKTGTVSTIKTYAGASLPAPFGSNSNLTGTVLSETEANYSTATDQAGKKRRSMTNGLGQLVRVDEPDEAGNLGATGSPVQWTGYNYDALGNLTTVNQGAQQRTFVYDSLSRLKSAVNPESGTISYSYDDNGNLTRKTDARGVVTDYTYDALNRVLTRSYSDATPQTSYAYDDANIAHSKGKLTKVSSAVSETRYASFDNLGRVLSSQQITDGVTFNFAYQYNLAGMLTRETYPSGRVVTNEFDANGDLAEVSGQFSGNNKTYAANFNYTSAGAVAAVRLGNSRWENTVFNSRLQPVQIGLGTSSNSQEFLKLNYDYGATENNGNLLSQQITIQGQFQAAQNYTYDSLNRLKSAGETVGNQTSWQQVYNYDRYGNRTFDANNTTTLGSCPQNQCSPVVDAANNRFVSGQGYIYDLSGNLTADAQGRNFFYDAENKQKEVRDSNNQILGQYFYDGGGKRVKKISSSETTIFVYSVSGRLASEYSANDSQPQTPTTSYLTTDHLGSPRAITDQAGNVQSRRDFMPFGEEITAVGNRTSALNYQSDAIRQKFTSYERDSEADLDYAQARYYNFRHGRFTTVDPLKESAKTDNAQSWNRYSYTFNNPLRFIDPSGMITGDFYDRQGNYLGTDGEKDNKIYLLKPETEVGYPNWLDKEINWGGKLEERHANDLKQKSTEVGGLIILTRTEEGKDYTIGEFKTVGGEKNVEGYMLEPAGPDTTTPNQDKRVPSGVYDLDNHSGKVFKDTFVISNENVPKERAILFHSGNNGGNTEGCIMPGGTKGNGTIGQSRNKMAELKAFIKSEGTSNVKFIIRNSIRK